MNFEKGKFGTSVGEGYTMTEAVEEAYKTLPEYANVLETRVTGAKSDMFSFCITYSK